MSRDSKKERHRTILSFYPVLLIFLQVLLRGWIVLLTLNLSPLLLVNLLLIPRRIFLGLGLWKNRFLLEFHSGFIFWAFIFFRKASYF